MTESHEAPAHEASAHQASAHEAPSRRARRAGEVTGPTLDRLLFFSDAVFAIALTLLALDLPVPEGDSNRALWHSFVSHLGHEYLTFLITFLVISRFWMVHHSFFAGVRAADRRLIQLDLLYLLWIVLLPFATRVLGTVGDYSFGTALYACTVALVGLNFAGIAWYCTRAGLQADDTGRGVGVGSVVVAAVFVVSIPIAFWNPDAGKYFWLTLFLTSPATAWYERRRAPAPPPAGSQK